MKLTFSSCPLSMMRSARQPGKSSRRDLLVGLAERTLTALRTDLAEIGY